MTENNKENGPAGPALNAKRINKRNELLKDKVEREKKPTAEDEKRVVVIERVLSLVAWRVGAIRGG